MNDTLENVLNVTLLEPRVKHPTIFARFDDLAEGETLIIHNDHDPKPLYYQLLSMRGEIFTWDYLENGPEVWRIKITKKISGEGEETLGDIAAKDLRKAQVFKKYGLDFCCGGKKTIREACREKGLNLAAVENELQQIDQLAGMRPLPYNDWSLDFLADYIVNTHHAYAKKNLPDIRGYARKVASVHGANHRELIPIRDIADKIYTEFATHMQQEEQILFPFIKNLVQSKNTNTPVHTSGIDSAESPIKLMEQDHRGVAKAMDEIRTLSHDFALPEDACASYSLLYRLLAEFEDDLHTHVHLENNILFPKTLALQKELN